MGQPTHHQAGHRDVDYRLAAGGQDFVILAQAPALGQPRERPRHDPAPRQHHNAALPITPQHRFQRKPQLLGDLVRLLSLWAVRRRMNRPTLLHLPGGLRR